MSPASEHLSDRLIVLRDMAGVTGETLAGLLGWSPAKVSRVLNGHSIPSVPDLRALAEAFGRPELADELVALREATTIHTRTLRRGDVRRPVDELTREAASIQCADGTVIPGLLQVPEYARAIFNQVKAVNPAFDVDARVAGRIALREVLQDRNKTFGFVIGYGALVMPPCPPDVMIAQLERLMWVMDLPNVTLGIVPQGRQVGMSFFNGFQLLDGLPVAETYGGETQDPEMAEVYATIFDMLMSEAAADDDARRLITAAAASLREN